MRSSEKLLMISFSLSVEIHGGVRGVVAAREDPSSLRLIRREVRLVRREGVPAGIVQMGFGGVRMWLCGDEKQ
nr:hypothetical protein CFP56_66529 [Quercus suber]